MDLEICLDSAILQAPSCHQIMYTLFYCYVSTILSLTQYITKSHSLGFEALTPCLLTASDGVAVHAFCEETITPCTLRASNGALVQAYCEPSLVSQPFASVTGISALQNTSSVPSIFQILGSSTDTVSWPFLE